MKRSAAFCERYYASDAQRAYLKLLLNEAFAHLYTHGTGIDPHHMDRLTKTEASAAIAQLKTAKEKGWKS